MPSRITFNGEFTLKELLEFQTIPQLKRMMILLGKRMKGAPKKQQLVDAVAHILTTEPERVVKSMFCYELKACMDVMEGRMDVETAEKSGLLFELNRFGFIYALDCHYPKESTLHFSKEMAQLLRPLIPAEMERREKDGSLMAEQLALGCANLYGFTDMAYMVSYIPELEKRLGHSLENEEITKLFYPVVCAVMDGRGKVDGVFVSPFAAFNGFDYRFEGAVEWCEEPKQFDFDTILGYGRMPYPVIASPATAKLKKVLRKSIKPDTTPEHIIRELWIFKQDESRNIGLPPLDEYMDFKRESDFTNAIEAVVDFMNNVPYWRLRGNTSEEIGRRNMERMRRSGQMPKISIGPNLRAMGIESFEQIQEMARKGESFPPFPPLTQPTVNAGSKVGRNDPCPCGSGKKFKNCCGR